MNGDGQDVVMTDAVAPLPALATVQADHAAAVVAGQQQPADGAGQRHDVASTAAPPAAPSKEHKKEQHKKEKREKAAAAAAAAAAASSSSKREAGEHHAHDDTEVELSEADMKFLDQDTLSRTKHNKLMREKIKEGYLRQDRYVRRHLDEFRSFLGKKVLQKYEAMEDDGTPLPPSKVFTVQPKYIMSVESDADGDACVGPSGSVLTVLLSSVSLFSNGEMRAYQILGLNFFIARHDNAIGGILGDEMVSSRDRRGELRCELTMDVS